MITLLSGIGLRKLSFDFEFEKFFPNDHPDSQLYQVHKDQFGYDNDYLQVIIENKGGLFQPAFIKKATAFEKSLRGIKDVQNVYSALSLRHIINSPTGILIYPLIHESKPEKLERDSIKIFNNPFYRSSFSNTQPAISIYVKHKHFNDPAVGDEIVKSILKHARDFEINDIRLVGKIPAAKEFVTYIQSDFTKYLAGCILTSLILLVIIFRDFRDAILPFLISLIAMIWTFGLIGWLGMKLNLLSSLLPPILFFVSMSDAVHLLSSLKNVQQGDLASRMRHAISKVWMPTLLTSITTAIGFLSLIWINTQPVQSLGIFASIGVLFAFIVTYTFGLCFYTLLPGKAYNDSNSGGVFLQKLFKIGKYTIPVLALVIITLVPGIFRLQVNSFLLDDLPVDSQVRNDFEYADKHFGGSKPYEIRLTPADTSYSIWDKPVMEEIVKVEHYLRDSFELARVQSPATIIKYIHQANNGGLNQYFAFPEDLSSYQKAIQLKDRIDPKRLDELVTSNAKAARIIGFLPELGSAKTKDKNEKLLQYLDTHIDPKLLKYRLTGTTYLIDKSHELLSFNLVQGLLMAVIIIGLLLGLYFRSWKLVLISMIPNLIPILMIAGILGWLGISLKMTTAIIFTVVFGIAVDDTIHMMASFIHSEEADADKRMMETFNHAGKAMIITSFIMIAGFSLFIFSSFGATFYMGLFVCLSLLIALIVDLTLLPILLVKYLKTSYVKKRKQNP